MLADPPRPGSRVELSWPDGYGTEQRLTRSAQVRVTPGGSGRFKLSPEDPYSRGGTLEQFGPLSVRWTFEGRSAGSRTAMPMATDSDEVRALVKRVAPALAGELSGDQLRHLWLELSSTAESDDDFAVTVRTEPDLRMPLHFFLASRVDVSYLPTVYWGWPTDHVLEPGEPEIGLRTGGYEDKYGGLSGALFVNSVLAFHSNDRKPATEPRWEEIRSENQGR